MLVLGCRQDGKMVFGDIGEFQRQIVFMVVEHTWQVALSAGSHMMLCRLFSWRSFQSLSERSENTHIVYVNVSWSLCTSI